MRGFIALIAAVVIVCGAWSAGWFYGAGEIRSAIGAMASNDGTSAPTVTCGGLNVVGFPFRFDIECSDATLAQNDVTVTVPAIRASALAYNPTQVKFSALPPVSVADAFSGAQSRIDFTGLEGSARVMTDDLLAGLSGEGWRIARISVVADGVDWVDTIVAEAPIMSASRVEGHIVDMPERHDATAGTSALAAYATLTDAVAPGLGVTGGEASLEAELTGLPDDLRAFGASDAVASWRAAGGQLKLVSLKGSAGEEFIESTGEVKLDTASRLDGQVSLKSKGLVERIGPLVPPEWQGLILGGEAADGSYSQTVTIKAGVVFAGLVPIAVVPPLL